MQTFTFNPNIRLSKAEQIFNSVVIAVECGRLAPNERLISINEFSRLHAVARDTVEKAYVRLKAEGFVESMKGKGYYITSKTPGKLRVLFVFNKLSSYKKIIYDAFEQTLEQNVIIDIFVHHYSPQLLKNCLIEKAGKYHYFVIMPHFFNHAEVDEYLNVLKLIPSEQLLLLDKNLTELPDLKMAVFQDFKWDIYDALRSAETLLTRYGSVVVVFPDHNNHPQGINEGVKQFCTERNLNFATISHPDQMQLTIGTVYVVLVESDLAIIIKRVRQSKFRLGKEIGIISFNETVFKELLDITVITTDFEQMVKPQPTLY